MNTENPTREFVDLTPKMALAFLEKNPGNRGLSSGRVAALSAMIKRGGWVLNGQPIIIDEDGNLLDGQHRCAAVVASGETVRTLMVRGVPRSTFTTIDSGRHRSGADVLSAGGIPNANRVAAVARLAWQYDMGVLGSRSYEARPSNADISDTVREYPDILEAVKCVDRDHHMKNSPVTFLLWATMREAPERAAPFWDAVRTGAGLRRGSPALKLRDTLLDNRNRVRKSDLRDILEFCLRAWVCHLSGLDVYALKPGILDNDGMRNSKGDVFIPMTQDEARPVTQQLKESRERAIRRA